MKTHFLIGVASISSKHVLKFYREEDLFISLSKDLFILYVLFLQYRSCDNTLEDCLFQISSYSHSYARITYEKTKVEVPLGPLLRKQNKKKRSINLCILKFPEFVKTIELRYDKGPRDWQSLLAVTRFRYVEALFHIFNYYWDKENHALYQGLLYVEVFDIDVPLYFTLCRG